VHGGEPSGPLSPRAASVARRDAILAAALDCYAEVGWAATTIADIRRRSGASTGSIYHHFGDKEGVAVALYVECLAAYRAGLRERLDRARSARGMIRSIVLHHMQWAQAHRVEARFLTELRGTEAVKRAEGDLRASNKAFLREIGERLEPHIESGAIRSLPHVLYTPIIIGPAHDVVRHWLRGSGRTDLSTLAKPLADAAWRALAGD